MTRLALLAGVAVLAAPSLATAQTDLGPLNLPTGSTGLPWTEDFELFGGTVPPYVALTNLDVATLAPDPEAWCNIGQLAPCLSPFSGSYALEMGLDPTSTNYHDVRNALVILYDPTGYTGDMNLSYMAQQFGDETDTVDGVWISNDGTGWYQLDGPWNKYSSSGTWTASGQLNLNGTPADTTIPFYVAFVQEDNFPFQDLDGVGIDDIKIPGDPFFQDLGPLTLPTGTVGLPWKEGFELFPGTVPPYLSVNSLDSTSLLPDPEGFCNVGQLGPAFDAFSGTYALEMGLIDGATTHLSRQIMVMAIDGTGYTGEKSISWMGRNFFEENHPVDGVWISDDGAMWQEIRQGWNSTTGEYEHSGIIDFSGTSEDTSGVFYIAFCQEDTAVFNTGGDGYAVDDISIPGTPAPPILEVVSPLTSGLFSTLSIESGYANTQCKFLASTTGGGPTIVSGIEVFLTPPILRLADVKSDDAGTALYSTVVPAGTSGMQVWLQGMVITQGAGVFTSNSVVETIL
jgi:hypothetical protein